MIHRRYAIPLLAVALTYVIAKLQWAHPIAWDEVEFFRATKWVAEGRVPFREFWEHHVPLQWFLFAPVAALVDSPGVVAILIMRWAQIALWIGVFALLLRIVRHAGIELEAALLGFLLLLAPPSSSEFNRANYPSVGRIREHWGTQSPLTFAPILLRPFAVVGAFVIAGAAMLTTRIREKSLVLALMLLAVASALELRFVFLIRFSGITTF
ncbi:MAG TPA: hypothetical protein VNA69_01155 [Thermoanaerobaculia bacterium]|nr:hypothetical protein [Thermoanaerobaculia bacterium]